MEAQRKRLFLGIPLAALLVAALVLLQPMSYANAVGVEGLATYDDCIVQRGFQADQAEDPISMNTVKNRNIVKTIHAEKEIFRCFLDQGNLPVIVDVTTYIEIYEDIEDRKVIETNAVATTCLKDNRTAAVIDCESYGIPSTPVPVGSTCGELGYITHPQEMNTVRKGKIAKTIEAQKEVFICQLEEPETITTTSTATATTTTTSTSIFTTTVTRTFGTTSTATSPKITTSATTITSTITSETTFTTTLPITETGTFKKVELILFTDTYENLETHEVEEVQFHSVRCVVLFSDNSDDFRDATVETCQFSTIEN